MFQLGGVDQIGNMRTGHDFISRMTNFEEDSYGMNFMMGLLRNFIFEFIDRCNCTINNE